MGLSITPWSPLASGLLSGKYRKVNGLIIGQGRVMEVKDSGNPVLEKFAKREKNWEVLEALVRVAAELNSSPAEVALAWVLGRPMVASVLIGVTRLEQLEMNLKALSLKIPEAHRDLLDKISAPEATELDHFFGDFLQKMVNGGFLARSGMRTATGCA